MGEFIFAIESIDAAATIVGSLKSVVSLDFGMFNIISGRHPDMGSVVIINACDGKFLGVRV